MLIAYKSDYEKITMGLLSYIGDLKETSRLMDEMDLYLKEENRHLFLWRSEETNDLAGVVGVEENSDMVLIRHISLNPSYREEGVTSIIFDKLEKKYAPKDIVGTIETASLITSWQKKKMNKENQQNDKDLLSDDSQE